MWLLVTAAMSVVAMVIGVLAANQALAVIAGAMFAVVAAVVGWRMARATADDDGHALAARSADLLAATWGWSGVAMIACYYLTGLHWQHAWQYGAGMLLIAALVWRYARWRTTPGSRFRQADMVIAARWLTRLQGLAALAGVVILSLSGKLDAGKQDWAANIVFVAGGLAIFAISRAALRAERGL
jgi:hypothetical protein